MVHSTHLSSLTLPKSLRTKLHAVYSDALLSPPSLRNEQIRARYDTSNPSFCLETSIYFSILPLPPLFLSS